MVRRPAGAGRRDDGRRIQAVSSATSPSCSGRSRTWRGFMRKCSSRSPPPSASSHCWMRSRTWSIAPMRWSRRACAGDRLRSRFFRLRGGTGGAARISSVGAVPVPDRRHHRAPLVGPRTGWAGKGTERNSGPNSSSWPGFLTKAGKRREPISPGFRGGPARVSHPGVSNPPGEGAFGQGGGNSAVFPGPFGKDGPTISLFSFSRATGIPRGRKFFPPVKRGGRPPLGESPENRGKAPVGKKFPRSRKGGRGPKKGGSGPPRGAPKRKLFPFPN